MQGPLVVKDSLEVKDPSVVNDPIRPSIGAPERCEAGARAPRLRAEGWPLPSPHASGGLMFVSLFHSGCFSSG